MKATVDIDKAEDSLGILEWFHFGERDRVIAVADDLRALGVRRLRFGVSWADYHADGGEAWFDWLLPFLGERFELLPCFLYTPPSLGEAPSTAAPPREPSAYADFIDHCITRYGEHFDTVELWNEPNNLMEWNYGLDRDWSKFCAMVGAAAHWARQRGKRTVLGGMAPIDAGWLQTMFDRGLMQYIDVIGVHGFPGSYDTPGERLAARIERIAEVLRENGHDGEIWLTETGYSTWRHDQFEQVRLAAEVAALPVARAYWFALRDLAAHKASQAGFHNDERDYHFGIQNAAGQPKLLYRLWSERGLPGVQQASGWAARTPIRRASTVVTGGAGFIGCNLAARLLADGERVRVVDNLSRPGVERNLEWLIDRYGDRVEFVPADVRDRHGIRDAVDGASRIFHLAGQVAVTTSLDDPLHDFEVNLGGTVNLLDAARRQRHVPPVIFASTNKVYGGLEDVPLRIRGNRYEPQDPQYLAHGVGEQRPLDFHSPYGCSKGGADQYVLDHARCMGVPAVVFRMSCIYGPHQFGTEDQGWVAHFLIRAMRGEPITLYGDGMQVRDILYVEDAVDAYLTAARQIDRLSGEVFNLGGGPSNMISLLQLLKWIAELQGGRAPQVGFAPWRPGDQRYYVSDTRRFASQAGWRAQVDARDGVGRLYQWLADQQQAATPRAVATAGKALCASSVC
ncbi:MAG: NAD-dependent epimerase/dehydratase family protein [Dyella sp.]|uniref:NAD-dependent epimerase/dehydratase family protein n=1 Tax=Dyella sp. TaxID=1869338 RepID=UPI003F7EE8B8